MQPAGLHRFYRFLIYLLFLYAAKGKTAKYFLAELSILLSVSAISVPVIALWDALKCSKPQGCPRPNWKALTASQAAGDMNNAMSTQSALRNLQEKNTKISLDPGNTALFEMLYCKRVVSMLQGLWWNTFKLIKLLIECLLCIIMLFTSTNSFHLQNNPIKKSKL